MIDFAYSDNLSPCNYNDENSNHDNNDPYNDNNDTYNDDNDTYNDDNDTYNYYNSYHNAISNCGLQFDRYVIVICIHLIVLSVT